MCYEIKKPINDKQRADFIVEYNHNQGLRIKDTEMFLFALEPDEIMGEKEIEIDVVDPETDETHKETITVPYPVKAPDYGKKQAEKERKRLDALTLTPSDVERALYKAKEMDFEDLKALIAEKAPQLDMKALAIEFRANNFYRGVEVNGMRLIDTVGALLGYTPADMDYLFTHKELPNNAEVV
ncbi:MAG: hypothetical protein VZR09_07725 [Candidatus Gastranaerophilaceae bacterium]|nr:hypothetical protein [Candidatus Gastranaerophilaceae bacterium]